MILKIKYSHKGAETRRESEGRGGDGRGPTDEGREDEWMIRMSSSGTDDKEIKPGMENKDGMGGMVSSEFE